MARNGQQTKLTPTIIVVDNDASVRQSLRFALAAAGFEVRAFARGDEMLGIAELPDRGCLIVDYNLPDMTGLDLLAQLRTRHVALPAILITTNPSIIVRRRAEEAGVPMIEKPLLGDTLINGILAALTRPEDRPSC
ncbi:MAG: response regulator [Xanthobacteraceae bacterium]